MKQQRPVSVSNVTTFEDLRKWTDFSLSDISDILNGHVSFNDNIDAKIASAVFSSANTDTQITHGLNRIPIGYIDIKKNATISFKDGNAAWTTTTIYLQASGSGSATFLVF